MGYCGLMPATLITLAHFAVSSAMSLPKSAGAPASTIPPMSARRSMIFGSARPALGSLFRGSTIAAGGFLCPGGAHHGAAPLAPLCTIAAAALRCGPRRRARAIGWVVWERRGHGGDPDVALPADEIGHRRPITAVGHVNHVDAGHHLEQLAGQMACRPDAGRGEAERARIALG